MEEFTLRDRFAMAALTGYIAISDDRTYNPNSVSCRGLTIEEWQRKVLETDADYLYQIADAMLKARAK